MTTNRVIELRKRLFKLARDHYAPGQYSSKTRSGLRMKKHRLDQAQQAVEDFVAWAEAGRDYDPQAVNYCVPSLLVMKGQQPETYTVETVYPAQARKHLRPLMGQAFSAEDVSTMVQMGWAVTMVDGGQSSPWETW